MKGLFVDTAGWMACADAADPAHHASCAARDAALEARQTLVTTDDVLDETLTLLRFRLGLPAASAWWDQIDRSPRLRWERIDQELPPPTASCRELRLLRPSGHTVWAHAGGGRPPSRRPVGSLSPRGFGDTQSQFAIFSPETR